ncbi:PD40 domain-containing protein [bacterium]|nr:PD40 domain-containing protein [bacterium]
MRSIPCIVCILLFTGVGFSQGFNHPELEWKTIEGEHFIVHYHQNTSWTANEALHVADDIFPAITSLYQYQPEEKTHIIIRDTDDYANGGAYYYDNKIEIWAMPLDYALRGSHYWLRDVITHEFTHIISLRAARKMPGNVPAAYFQVISYEPERREDVLYGYPNGIASYPLPSVSVPMWWAEGISQFQTDSMRWDWWDSIRDMMLRDRIKYDKVLTLNEMDGFGKVGIGNESVYDHGFSFVGYLAQEFGQDIIRRITTRISKLSHYGFYTAMEAETGVESKELWSRWKNDLATRQALSFEKNETISPIKFIQREGDANFYPRWNKTGNALGFISNAGETYLSRTALFVKDSTKDAELLVPGAEGFDWSPDSMVFVYARKEFYDGGIPDPRTKRHKNHHLDQLGQHQEAVSCDRCQFLMSGSRYSDLFIAHRDSLEIEEQLTFGERVKNPVWSPSGDKIAFVNLRDGTNNICIAFPGTPDSIQQLSFFEPGTQVYTLRWSPDGRSIIFDYTGGSNRDIAIYDTRDEKILPLLNEIWDERDPVFKDNYQILYSDDRTGVFNIYSYDIISGDNKRLTNVTGGAFQAEWHEDKMYYSLYDSLGFNIAVLDDSELLNTFTLPLDMSLERIIPPTWERHVEKLAAENYILQYGPMFLLPRLQIEIDQSKGDVLYKPGFYFFSDEILSNYSMVGGFGLAPNLDMDLFISTQYRGFLPTLTFEFYQMVRHTQEELWYYDHVWPAQSELTFSLTQGVLSADILIPPTHRLILDISASNYRTSIGLHTVGQGLPAGGISYDYFKGWDWGLKWSMSHINLRQERSINPSGYKASFSVRDNHHKFLDEYGYDESTERWGNIFSSYHYAKLNASGFYGYLLPVKGQFVISNETEINLIDNNRIDDFFYEFAGGLPGLRGYPFYSMKGSRRFVSTSTLRFPIFRDNYSRLAHMMLRDLYLGLHGQVGAAWSADPENVEIGELKSWMKHERDQIDLVRDVGVDLRFALNSYYAFPTAFELGAYYGLDEVSVTTNNDELIRYGGEWRYYWKVLFGFE